MTEAEISAYGCATFKLPEIKEEPNIIFIISLSVVTLTEEK